MTYTVKWSHEFKRNVKRAVKRGLDPAEMKNLISLLRVDSQLPPSRRDHPLHGEFEGCRECHIHGDWLLVYRKNRNTLIMTCVTTGTHSDIFKE